MTQKYADFISGQNFQYVNSLSEEDHKITAKVEKHTRGEDALHMATNGDHHIYHGGDGSSDMHTYHVHHEKTGKTHDVHLPGPTDAEGPAHKNEIRNQLGGLGPHTRSTVNHIHRNHSAEFDDDDAGKYHNPDKLFGKGWDK